MLKISTTSSQGIPIEIDGVKYELKPYDSLKFQDFFELQKFAQQFDNFKDIESANLTDEQVKKLEESLDTYWWNANNTSWGKVLKIWGYGYG